MNVEFIYDQDCPNVKETRANLMKAFSKADMSASWKEWDRNSSKTPDHARRFGSPTILINGKDIMGVIPESDANCCRIYNGAGVPTVDLIVQKLKTPSEDTNADKRLFGFLGTFSIGPGVLAAFLAKASCPLCYPAIAGFLSSVGLGFLFKGTYFYVLMRVFFLLALFGLAFKAKQRRGYLPFWLGLVASVTAFAGHYYNQQIIFYFGIGLLVLASIWNLIPVKDKECNTCS